MGKVTPVQVRGLGIAIAGVGLIALSFHVTTYVQYYDDIGILEKKGLNSDGDDLLSTADLPLSLLLQIEILGAIILTFGGMFGVFGYRNKLTRTALLMMSFLAFVAFCSSFVVRTLHLGFGDIVEGHCNYLGDPDIDGVRGDYLKACPTTRHEAQRPTDSSPATWNITSTEPLFKSDCIFWFWDNTFTLESALISIGGGDGQGAGITIEPAKKEALKNEMLENMNWADKKNYGYMAVDSPCNNDLGATDCIADGRTVYETIETKADSETDAYGVVIVKKLTGSKLPDITFCYYWGCNEHCNEYRYRINRVLHYSSLTIAVFSGIFLIMAAAYTAGTPVGYNQGAKELAVAEAKLIEGIEEGNPKFSKKWKPMNVETNPTRKRRIGDSRTLRF